MEYLISLTSGVVTKLWDSLVVQITKQFGYLIYYSQNIETFKNELKILEGRKDGVQGMVDADKRNTRQIVSTVEHWLRKVNTIENESQGFYDDQVNNKCLGGCFPNLVSRYSLSKKAKRLTACVISLKEEKLEVISYPAPPPRIGLTFSNGIKSFETRKSIMIEVIENLKDEDAKIIGICGMGGVGKTTFVKEVIKILEEDKLFDEVVMAVVSQNLDYKKIQGQLADSLGLKFEKETIQGRACQLQARLKNTNSILIVLDDIWIELDFESIGLPSIEHHRNYKILFTSRIEDVCHKMKSQKNFTIPILSQDEGSDLFREMVGDNLADKPDIDSIAKEIVNECKGLPIAIVTIAKALANKEKHAWEDTLEHLRKSSLTPLSEIQTSVYSCIKLSYNFLGNEEERYFLFLCCLFPEDFDIPVEILLRHGVGLRMFKGIDALWKVRNRVHTIVDKLKKCFMLLDSNKKECVKMHDVVRDVIISITSKEEHGFMVQGDSYQLEWHKEKAWHHSSAISLMFNEANEYSDILDYPELKLLQVASKKRESVPENFFQGMNMLMVLSLQNMNIHSMPSVFRALDNIHTLRLEDCNVGDISIIGKELRKVEILSFANSNIMLLPIEIGQLSHLRLLDLTECNYLIQIATNVLASLSRLEELYLRVRNFSSKETNHILFELQLLSHHLKVVEIALMVDETLPRDLIFKNIKRFWVYMGDSSTIFHGLVRRGYLHPNILKLDNAYYNYIKRSVTIQQLLQQVEILSLVDIKQLKNVILDLDERGFPFLKHLSIESCSNLEYVVDACDDCVFSQLQSFSLRNLDSLKGICHVANHLSQKVEFSKDLSSCQCFGSLTDVKIEYCHNLKTIFTLFSRTTSLATLQRLHVAESQEIECIISNNAEQVQNSMIEFPNLVELKLQELPNLIGFIKTTIMHRNHSSNAKVQEYSQSVENDIESGQLSSMSGLKSKDDELVLIDGALFKFEWMKLFPKLEKILLHACSSLDTVFDMKQSNLDGQSGCVFFAQLKELKIFWLSKLNHIWGNVSTCIQGFQNLKSIEVKNCNSLRYVLTPNITRTLTQLQKMVIQSCSSMEKVVGRGLDLDDDDDDDDVGKKQHAKTLVFGQLHSLTLKDLPSLVNFSLDSYEIVWPSLRFLCIDGCPRLKTSNMCIQTLTKQENFIASSSSPTNDVVNSTFKEDSPRLCCLGRTTAQLAFFKLKAKALPIEKGFLDVNSMNNKAEIGSPMPILEQLLVKGWDSLDVLFQLNKNQDSGITVNCLVKLMVHVPTSPIVVTTFSNLTLLSLDACHRLRYLFSYSIAKLLVKLQEIKVSNCKMIEQLVQREGEDNLTLSLAQSNSLKVLGNSSSDPATIPQEACALK